MSDVDSSQPYILKIHELLSPSECAELIQRIEDLDPKTATINSAGGTKVNLDVRNNDRVIFDDQALADDLLKRIDEDAPREIFGRELVGVNERFRCYRYQAGMRFAPHADGSFVRNESERSYYSFLVYLNAGFEGGNTTFMTNPEISIEPEVGMGLLFQHPIIHEGSVVNSGIKYVARTDLMYRKTAS
ncbi:MAG: 2OG-Fe(II) oxygenase [Mariniblastus sp.]